MRNLIIILLTTTLINSQPPSLPLKYKQKFTESLSLLNFSGTTTGTIYYNFSKNVYRIDRENGKLDRYCGTYYKFTDTPCSHYVSNDIRYLYFPEKKKCCKCCEKKNGCGVLKNNWLKSSKKIKEFEIEDEMYEVWRLDGLQKNFVTNLKSNKEIVKIEQESNDTMEFDRFSMTMDFDDSVFDLPEECGKGDDCGYFNMCWLVK